MLFSNSAIEENFNIIEYEGNTILFTAFLFNIPSMQLINYLL